MSRRRRGRRRRRWCLCLCRKKKDGLFPRLWQWQPVVDRTAQAPRHGTHGTKSAPAPQQHREAETGTLGRVGKTAEQCSQSQRAQPGSGQNLGSTRGKAPMGVSSGRGKFGKVWQSGIHPSVCTVTTKYFTERSVSAHPLHSRTRFVTAAKPSFRPLLSRLPPRPASPAQPSPSCRSLTKELVLPSKR